MYFTFQPGDIQMRIYLQILYKTAMNLHSNLVIFKFEHKKSVKSIFKKFTFQSGDIQIIKFMQQKSLANAIYIPIW